MPIFVPQNSMTGGEVAPSLRSRQDLTKFATSLSTALNTIVHAHGGASNRAGLELVGEVLDSAIVHRLISFSFSTTQTYSLEFGDQSMRVIKDGGYVLLDFENGTFDTDISGWTDDSGGSSTFTWDAGSQSAKLTSAGSGHGNHAHMEQALTTIAGRSYTVNFDIITADVELYIGTTSAGTDIFTANYVPGLGQSKTFVATTSTTYIGFVRDPVGTAYVDNVFLDENIFEITTPYLEADLPLLKYTQSADVMTLTHNSYADRELSRTAHASWTLATITRGTLLEAPAGLAVGKTGFAGAAANYKYKVTAVAGGDESLPTAPVTQTGDAAWPAGAYMSLSWTASDGAEYYKIYKQALDGGSYGYIGTSDTVNFVDDNIQAELDHTAPASNYDPFPGADDYPGCVAYFQQRLVYANTNNNPQTQWMSKSGNYHNFNHSIPVRDDDSIEITIAAREVNAIRHLVPIGKRTLVALTTGSPWVITPASDGVMTPTNIEADPQGKRGASDVNPLVTGNAILFVQDKGSIVRDLAYTEDEQVYDGVDLSILANHLFENKQVKEWAFAEAPHSIVWCVMSDGSLIGLTYMKEHEVWGWHRHETEGTFESVCSISEGNEDAVYFIVKRKIGGVTKRFVERMHSRYFASVEDAFFVDSGLSYDVPINIVDISQGNPIQVTTDTPHGLSTGALVDHADIVGMTELNGQRYKIKNAAGTTYELTHQYTGADIDGTGFTEYEEGGKARKAITSVSGLDHLEGELVSVLADGNVKRNVLVTAGAITLDPAASRIHAGLPYVSDIETLPGDLVGKISMFGKKKLITKVVLKLLRSRAFWVGPNADKLTEFKQRGLQDEGYNEATALMTGEADVAITAGWREEGTVYIRQEDPLPLTVLSIQPGVDVGE